MELKPYQQKVLDDLENFLLYLQEKKNISVAFDKFWADKVGVYDHDTGTGMVPYKSAVPGVPQVCVKVPTQGAKHLSPVIASRFFLTIYQLLKTVWLSGWFPRSRFWNKRYATFAIRRIRTARKSTAIFKIG